MQRQIERCGWLLLIALGAIVLAFMGPSLAITATGTARFAVAMGYRAGVGYAVGAVFDLAKGMLPIALLALLRTALLPLLCRSHGLARPRKLQRARDARDRDYSHSRY